MLCGWLEGGDLIVKTFRGKWTTKMSLLRHHDKIGVNRANICLEKKIMTRFTVILMGRKCQKYRQILNL